MSNINHGNDSTTEEVSKSFWKNRFVWVIMAGIIVIIILTAFWGYKLIIQIPAQKQAELEVEFKEIVPLPNVRLVDYNSSQKITQALVSAKYTTSTNPADIFKHYDEQLKQQGWQFQGTTAVTDWDRDLGGKAADYCKGDYGAELQYAGEKANYGWTYGFSIDWGLNDCKKNADNTAK